MRKLQAVKLAQASSNRAMFFMAPSVVALGAARNGVDEQALSAADAE